MVASKVASAAAAPKNLGFTKRLNAALEANPLAPFGHGRQVWLRSLLMDKHGLSVSPEGVRKWFAGEARPRPDIMRQIAQALNVDEAWLALGITPEETPADVKRRNAVAEGVVNIAAGMIQISGGHIAFSEGETSDVDIHAIIRGRKVDVEVKLCRESLEGAWTAAVSKTADQHTTIIAIHPEGTDCPTFFRLPPDLIRSEGTHMGGYIELHLTQKGNRLQLGEKSLVPFKSFASFD
jgi:hypothetical protein